MKLQFDSLQVPLALSGNLSNVYREQKNPIIKYGYIGFLHFISLVGGPLFTHLKMRGIKTIIWVVNTEDELKMCLSYEGVEGVMTDVPEKFIEYSTKVC